MTAVEVLEGDTAKLEAIVEQKKKESSNNLAVPATSTDTLIIRKPVTSETLMIRQGRSAAGSMGGRSVAPSAGRASAYSRRSKLTLT